MKEIALSYTVKRHLVLTLDSMKFDSNIIDDAVIKLKEALPDDIGEMKRAGEEKLKLILEGVLQKLELVSREEYEVQTEVLKRTRARVEQLEQRISILEKKE